MQFRMHRGVTKISGSGMVLEQPTKEGDSPVDETASPPVKYPEYHGTRVILWETAGTTPQG